MASSSTSTSHSVNNDYVYDIFLNHRGPDVKKTFATYLYKSLCKHELQVFLDDPELRPGDSINPQLESAIKTSSVHIAILSPGYADSKWCLDELVLMVECMSKYKSTIIPVFYGVKPEELRWVKAGKGVYGQALLKLQEKKNNDGRQRHDMDTIEKWKNALAAVAGISGFDRNKYKSGKTGVLQCHEAVFELCNPPFVFKEEQLLEDVVEAVLKKVKIALHVSEYPTGLQEKLKDFETTIPLQQDVGKVIVTGIVGLGGVGKTTLAKQFFNSQRSKYKRLCILEDIRDNTLTTLQKYLLKDLTQKKDEEIRSINEGKGKLRRLLPSSDCLIILDDVDNIEQLEALLYPAKDALKSSSLILVTSRNKDVLTGSDIPESSIYTLRGLDPQHSKELFCLHAFRQHHPTAGFDIVVNKCLDSCLGLPLSIKVLASPFRGINDLNHWEAQLRKISYMIPDDIQGRLKISYDGLDEEEKKIFLDIACFFRGEDRDRVIRIWNGSGWEGSLGLWKLEKRCLVEVDSENRLRMHDHVRDMGRSLAAKEPPDGELRLWNPTDNLFHKLSGQLPVRGINLVDENEDEPSVENFLQSLENLAEPARTCLLSNMSGLQLLKAKGDSVERLFNVCHQLPNLIYLDWLNCPYFSFPSSISTRNLRVLHIMGDILKTLWQHESQVPLQLMELWITSPFLNDLDFIGNLQHLEIFVVSSSFYLESLPDSIGNLAGLQHLGLMGCSTLQTLPDSVGNLTGLQHLGLMGCSALQTLPDSVGNLAGLQHLDLTRCSALQTLPDSVGNLAGLQHLRLIGCTALQALPDSVGNLAGLQHLNLRGCFALKKLPDSVGNLAGLWEPSRPPTSGLGPLFLSAEASGLGWEPSRPPTSGLEQLPRSADSSGLVWEPSRPPTSGLEQLPVSDASGLWEPSRPPTSGLEGLLRSAEASRLGWEPSRPPTSGLDRLLRSADASGLGWEPSRPPTSALEPLLRSADASGLGWEPSRPPTSALEELLRSADASGLVGNLAGLQHLDLRRCSALQTLPDSVGNLAGLQHLDLSQCSDLQKLPDSVWNLAGLQHLDLGFCYALQTLPDSVGNLAGLQHLNLRYCSALQTLPDSVGKLRSLRSLFLSHCSDLQRLPDSIGNLTSLQTLGLAGCSNLEMVPNVEHLGSLKYLNVSECSKLQWDAEIVEQLRQRLGEGSVNLTLQEDCSDGEGFIGEGRQEVSSDGEGSNEEIDFSEVIDFSEERLQEDWSDGEGSNEEIDSSEERLQEDSSDGEGSNEEIDSSEERSQ